MDVDQKQCDLCDVRGEEGKSRPAGWETFLFVSTTKPRTAESTSLTVDLCRECLKKPISQLIAYVKKCGDTQT